MIKSILLDPALLLPAEPGNPAAMTTFWIQLAAWSSDERVKVGEATYRLACEYFAVYGWPDAPRLLPVSLRRDTHRLLSRLLTRVLVHVLDARECTVPDYAGTAQARAAIAEDLSRCATDSVLAIASVKQHWSGEGVTASVLPPPPGAVALCLRPGEELHEERSGRTRQYFAERRLHVVGGQFDQRIAGHVARELGPRDLLWLPCERHKQPSLDSWRGLVPERDIAICITGQISHAVSGRAQRVARQRQVAYLEIESVRDIVPTLQTLAQAPLDGPTP